MMRDLPPSRLMAVFLWGLLAWTPVALAAPLALKYGANFVDINADGVEDVIVKTRADVLSPHNADGFLIAVQKDDKFHEVPRGQSYREGKMGTFEGAECILLDYQFLLEEGKPLIVKRFHRPLGDGFDGTYLPVIMTTYRLRDRETLEDPIDMYGTPRFFLEKLYDEVTEKSYCSVRELMK